jgi:hypothetical protein
MPTKGKSSKPAACERCSGQNLARRITTYPVPVGEPPFSSFLSLKENRSTLAELPSTSAKLAAT